MAAGGPQAQALKDAYYQLRQLRHDLLSSYLEAKIIFEDREVRVQKYGYDGLSDSRTQILLDDLIVKTKPLNDLDHRLAAIHKKYTLLTGHLLPPLSIPKKQWLSAEKFFAKNPNATELNHKDARDYSFIKVNGLLYAKGEVVREGPFANTTLLQNKEGQTFVAKTEDNYDHTVLDTKTKGLPDQAKRKYDVGTVFKGEEISDQTYTLLSFAPGPDLEHMLYWGKDVSGKKHPKELSEFLKLNIAIAIIREIMLFHNKRIIHGDLNPSTIKCNMIEDNVEIKLIDTNKTILLAPDQQSVPMSQIGAVGSQTYLSSEVKRYKELHGDTSIIDEQQYLLDEIINLIEDIKHVFHEHLRAYDLDTLNSPEDFIHLLLEDFDLDDDNLNYLEKVQQALKNIHDKKAQLNVLLKKVDDLNYSFATDTYAIGKLFEIDLKLEKQLFKGLVQEDPRLRPSSETTLKALIAAHDKLKSDIQSKKELNRNSTVVHLFDRHSSHNNPSSLSKAEDIKSNILFKNIEDAHQVIDFLQETFNLADKEIEYSITNEGVDIYFENTKDEGPFKIAVNQMYKRLGLNVKLKGASPFIFTSHQINELYEVLYSNQIHEDIKLPLQDPMDKMVDQIMNLFDNHLNLQDKDIELIFENNHVEIIFTHKEDGMLFLQQINKLFNDNDLEYGVNGIKTFKILTHQLIELKEKIDKPLSKNKSSKNPPRNKR